MHEIPPDWDGQVTREWTGYTLQADIAFEDIKFLLIEACWAHFRDLA